ncbi:MAG: hypothetical protein F2667_03050 [Actinobacteria bacterium]|uniref:Unannotated protein n=1 Tax=freshwater metagenome TaxID=449393 RepID=A0A6J6PBF2_9ZZZZ|nr:hypothetical protein [Actinomycetota bacterium]
MSSSLARVMRAALSLGLAATGLSLAIVPTADAAPTEPSLARPAQGAAALVAIGSDLAAVARLNGLSAAQLADVLRTDSTAWIGTSGKLFFRERDYAAPSASERRSAARAAASKAAPYPSSQTFQLHSKPGSNRTIYLDFDGYTVANDSQWLSDGLVTKSVEGYSLDANTSTFSEAEHAAMQEIWQRVTEDYAPFDVDVTTQAPAAAAIDRSGSGDQVFGTVAVVTNNKSAHQQICGDPSCLGIAYTDVFTEAGDHMAYQPAWTFSGYYNDAKTVAETISHEVGHNFGLLHDGVVNGVDYYEGQGLWGPLMGSANLPLSQWDKGEYKNANNKQADLDVIATGAPMRTDDVGNTVAAAATTLPIASTPNVISTPSDVDVYSLGSCTGDVVLKATPAPVSPNLDIKLTVLDATGKVLATADPASAKVNNDVASGLDASLTYAATGAPIYAAVDGVGSGNPLTTGYSDYGSLGQYSLSAAGCGTSTGTAPGAPTGLATSGLSPVSVTLTWSAPASDGGSPVTEYRLSRTGGGSSVVLAPTARSYTFTGLNPSTAYTLSVAAANSAGPGPGASVTVTTNPEEPDPTVTAPDAPLIGKAKAGPRGGARTASISWAAPFDGGSRILGYTVYAHKVNGRNQIVKTKTFEVDATVTAVSIKLGTGFWAFQVLAYNEVGDSDLSDFSAVVQAR